MKVSESAMTIKALRSSGPGGQHVNKTSTKIEIRFNIYDIEYTNLNAWHRFKIANKSYINSSNEFVITCSEYKSQNRNLIEAKNKIQALLANSTKIPKKRKKTKPSRSSQKKRLDKKNKDGQQKKLRKKPSFDS